jgi:hypothetical protein
MFLGKKATGHDSADEGPFAVMVQPLDGHTDQEVVKLLRSSGATEVSILAPGFISAEITRSALKRIETIAHVQPKVWKRLS